MKRFQFKTGLIFASWALVLIFGCHKKKPPIPPQEQPPTITTTQQPAQQEQPPTTQPPAQEPVQPQPEATNKPPDKPTPKHPQKPRVVKKQAPEPDKTPVEIAKASPPPEPPRVVIQEGGPNTQSGQVGTSAPGSDNQVTTQQLLESTEANVRTITKRQLSSNEQSTLAQINDYAKQSRQAMKDGDLVRAHNLALKAHLLSDDLAKAK